jgi:indolepyruvate ferredoxin oxidoreductase
VGQFSVDANKVGFDATRDTALALAKLPEQIRGFGHIKEESVVGVRVRWNVLMQPLQTPPVMVKREPLPT